MPSHRVSVVITSYNQEDYLREAIESVMRQTMRPHEIIVADDHSTRDGSVELIRRYETRHRGWVRGVFQEGNVGIPANRNGGLAAVTGDHLTVLDGDDRLCPDFIEKSTGALIDQPEALCVYSNRYDMTSEGERSGARHEDVQPSGDLFGRIARGYRGILRTMLAPVHLVREAGGFNEDFYHHDGYVLSLRLARTAHFAYVHEPLMEKRSHPGGTSKTINLEERIRCFSDVAAEVARLSGHLPDEEREQVAQVWNRRLDRLRQHRQPVSEEMSRG